MKNIYNELKEVKWKINIILKYKTINLVRPFGKACNIQIIRKYFIIPNKLEEKEEKRNMCKEKP